MDWKKCTVDGSLSTRPWSALCVVNASDGSVENQYGVMVREFNTLCDFWTLILIPNLTLTISSFNRKWNTFPPAFRNQCSVRLFVLRCVSETPASMTANGFCSPGKIKAPSGSPQNWVRESTKRQSQANWEGSKAESTSIAPRPYCCILSWRN